VDSSGTEVYRDCLNNSGIFQPENKYGIFWAQINSGIFPTAKINQVFFSRQINSGIFQPKNKYGIFPTLELIPVFFSR
jgi:hypothetical protein